MINVTSETLLDGSRYSLCQQTFLTLIYDTAKCQMTPLTRLVMRLGTRHISVGIVCSWLRQIKLSSLRASDRGLGYAVGFLNVNILFKYILFNNYAV